MHTIYAIINLVFPIFLASNCFCIDPSNYEYYTNSGIKSGLKADSENFVLNGRQITLLSGSLHYFRLPQQYWKNSLTKLRAAGLNAVQTYAPWNLHEETPDKFDFETGFLNLAEFLKAAKEADLFVMFRMGPYICSEWELGGFPSWLLRDPNMKLRSNYKPYLSAVEKYFNKILPIINEHQFTKGGPIIGLQFENEFGEKKSQNDHEYFEFMRDVIVKSGYHELLFNCDSGMTATSAVKTGLKGVLETTNFDSNSLHILDELRKSQPNKPLYISEFWSSEYWNVVWGRKFDYSKMTTQRLENDLNDILFKSNASLNFYMFFGGTNFGFMNGGEEYGPDVTSYDYYGLLSESGNYTDNYWKAKEVFAKFTKERELPKTHIPDPPKVLTAANYGTVKIKDYISFDELLNKITPLESSQPKLMEMLDIGTNYGQNFGFILYRINTNKFKHLTITGGVSDRGVVMIDDKEVAVINNKDYHLNTTDSQFANKTGHTLDIFVENTGRQKIGPGINTARKGLNGNVVIDEKVTSKYLIYPMDFKQKFVEQFKHLKGTPFGKVNSPSLFRAELEIKDKPRDTFLRLDNWKKGNVFVNGFNIGRYYEIGPQKTLYIPAPLLKTGINDIYVFELHSGFETINFVDKPDIEK